MYIDGVKKSTKERKRSDPAESFILPDDFSIENPQPDIVIVGKKRPLKQSPLGSPVGLKRKRLAHKRNNKIFIKTLCLFFVIIISFFVIFKAYNAKKELDKLSDSAQGHLIASVNYIDQGEFSESMKEAGLARSDIERMKLLAQSWGQDIRFLRAISSDSKLVANEQLLDATYLIVETLNGMNEELSVLGAGDKEGVQDIPGEKFIYNIAKSKSVVDSLSENGVKNLERSKKSLARAMPRLNGNYRKQTEDAIKTIDKTISSLQSIKAITSEDLPWLSGLDGSDKNIMILLQNNAELRGGSGGSLGSFGIARFTEGKLKTIDFAKNIYKIDQAFEQKGEFIEVPEELKWLRCNGDCTWTLKDSGWAVDGAQAAEKIIWFYEKETGQQVDGVIMIDTTAIIDLLGQLGPIEMPSYQKTISAQNFRYEVEYEVHKGYFERSGGKEENEPKKILSDMMPIFLEKTFSGLKDQEQALKILGSLGRSLKKKDITLFFENEQFQGRVNKMNYAGGVSPAAGDYLYVNNSNIGGEKSSLKINQSVAMQVEIQENSSTRNQVRLKRSHTGNGIWPDGINKNFTRLLLPERAEINSFKPVRGSFEKYFDKGVMENSFYTSKDYSKMNLNFWMSTRPGEESELLLNYTSGYTPLKSGEGEFTYILNLQKQPGAPADHVDLSILFPEQFEPMNVNNFKKGDNKISLRIDLKSDYLVKIKFLKKRVVLA